MSQNNTSRPIPACEMGFRKNLYPLEGKTGLPRCIAGRFNVHMERFFRKLFSNGDSARRISRLACIALAAIAATALAGCARAAAPSVSTPAGSSDDSRVSVASTASGKVDAPSASDVLPESEWGNLFESIGAEAVAFGRRVQGELPVAACVQWSGVGGGEPVEFADPGTVRAVFNALASADVGDEAGEVRTDDYTSFQFVFADGEQYSVSFDSLAITLHENGRYVVYSVDAGADFHALVAMARQATMEGLSD